MFEWDDIVIVGDSFCQYRCSDDAWPSLLASKLTGLPATHKPVRGAGEPGSSWWTSRGILFNELMQKPTKILVMCHTDIQRIPSEFDFSLNPGSVFAPDGLEPNPIVRPRHPNEHKYVPEIKEAAQMYFKYLNFHTFNQWVWRHWANELDAIIVENNIPYVIHLFGFSVNLEVKDHSVKNTYEFKNGISDTSHLWRICDDRIHHDLKDDNHIYRKNHFSAKNNVKIANALYNALIDYKPGLRDLKLLGK